MGEFRMPVLGADMERGTLSRWRVSEGDHITKGDIIADVDTDKATMEVEVFESGIVERLLVDEGETVPVGTPLAVLVAAGETAGAPAPSPVLAPVSYTHLRAHETGRNLVCRL